MGFAGPEEQNYTAFEISQYVTEIHPDITFLDIVGLFINLVGLFGGGGGAFAGLSAAAAEIAGEILNVILDVIEGVLKLLNLTPLVNAFAKSLDYLANKTLQGFQYLKKADVVRQVYAGVDKISGGYLSKLEGYTKLTSDMSGSISREQLMKNVESFFQLQIPVVSFETHVFNTAKSGIIQAVKSLPFAQTKLGSVLTDGLIIAADSALDDKINWNAFQKLGMSVIARETGISEGVQTFAIETAQEGKLPGISDDLSLENASLPSVENLLPSIDVSPSSLIPSTSVNDLLPSSDASMEPPGWSASTLPEADKLNLSALSANEISNTLNTPSVDLTLPSPDAALAAAMKLLFGRGDQEAPPSIVEPQPIPEYEKFEFDFSHLLNKKEQPAVTQAGTTGFIVLAGGLLALLAALRKKD